MLNKDGAGDNGGTSEFGDFLDAVGGGVGEDAGAGEEEDIFNIMDSANKEVVEEAPIVEELSSAQPDEVFTSPAEAPPVEEAPKDEMTLLKEQNALLIARLNEIQEQINKGEKPKEVEPPKAEDVQQPPAAQTSDIFDGQDFDEVLSDKGKFLSMLGKALQIAHSHTVETIYKNMASSLPQVVSEQVNYNQKISEVVKEFYKSNDDLAAVKPTVQAVMQSVQGKNPGKDLAEILKITAEETRKLLGLRPKGVTPPASNQIPPSAPGTGSTRMSGGKPATDDVGAELDVLKSLGF
jgi:hypothetical protein